MRSLAIAIGAAERWTRPKFREPQICAYVHSETPTASLLVEWGARILYGLYRIAPIVFILPIVVSRRNRSNGAEVGERARASARALAPLGSGVCIYTFTHTQIYELARCTRVYSIHTGARTHRYHRLCDTAERASERPADLRRSNYSDTHITCVPTVVSGRIERICRGSRSARCSPRLPILT